MNAKSVLCSLPPNQQACHQALDWVKNKSVASAWQTCTRPDWMLWALANVPHGKVACPPRWLACCVAEELISLAKRKGIELPDYLGSTIAKVKAWLVRRGRYPGLAKIRAEYFDQHNTLPDPDAALYIAWLVESLTYSNPEFIAWDQPSRLSSRGCCQQTGFALLDLTPEFLTIRDRAVLCRLIRRFASETPEVLIYKHSDGYPSDTLVAVADFLKEFVPARGIEDSEYLMAQLLVALVNRANRDREEFEAKFPFPTVSKSSPYRFLGFGICGDRQLHWDIEYLYCITPAGVQVYIMDPVSGDAPVRGRKLLSARQAKAVLRGVVPKSIKG